MKDGENCMAKNTANKAKELKTMEEAAGATKCVMCGDVYPAQERHFPRSYSPLYFGNGYYCSMCKNCVKKLFTHYMVEFNDPKVAFERVCMKLDFYYHPHMFDSIFEKGGMENVWTEYYKQINHTQWGTGQYTYDTTLEKRAKESEPDEECVDVFEEIKKEQPEETIKPKGEKRVSQDIISFFGYGFTNSEYKQLKSQYDDWVKEYECKDKAQKELLKNMCIVQLQIQRALQKGEKIETLMDSFNKLLSSAKLKSSDSGNNLNDPNAVLGCWVEDIEKYTPADYYTDKEKYSDHDGILDYIMRYLYRPLKNLLTGSRDLDKEHNLQQSDSG